MMASKPFRFWGYAATFGSLWGAMEITVGSFLHAIKLPFSGVVLAGVGAALLMTLRVLLPSRGIVFAAGVVCAGIKLLSPAGAVLGPMIAILVESLLVEAALYPIGATRIAGALGGLASTLWALTQKLITQTLFYGMPILGIYQGIARQAEQLLHLPASDGALAAVLLVCVVAGVGASLGVVGVRVGTSAARQLPGPA